MLKSIVTKVDRGLCQIVGALAACLMAAVVVIGGAQVIWRYGFNSSLIWSEELIRLLYIWMIFIAAVYAPHMRVGLVTDIAKGWVARVLAALHVAVMASMLAILLIGAIQLESRLSDDTFVTLGVSRSWYWYAAIVGALLWLLRSAFTLVNWGADACGGAADQENGETTPPSIDRWRL